MYLRRFVSVLAASMLFGVTAAGAQTSQAQTVDGEVIAVPVVESGAIVLDGDLGDWATLPAVVTNDGPQPSTDPANSGQLRWQIAASDQTLYVAATITDDVIIAGRNGDNYWNEDSIEVYLNFGDLAATTYGDGVGQITISAVDRGNTDPNLLSLSGNGAPDFDTSGFVFATTAGWGFEIAIGLDGKTEVFDGGEFGLQMQANGSSGEDRDLKISWSIADVADTSFQDPSVFGLGVFAGGPADAGVADDGSGEEASVAAEDPVEAAEDAVVDSAAEVVETDGVVEITPDSSADTEPEPGRTLLIAAVISAVSILIGGLWFERRRKRSESEMATATGASDLDEGIPDDEFDAMITSILDDE